MTPLWRMCLRRLRFTLLAAGATVVILLGVVAGLMQLAMPWLERHPQHVEHWLSMRLDHPVTIGRLRGAWVGGGPLLSLDNVSIGGRRADQPAFVIAHAELAFDPYALFRRNGAFSEFRLGGLDLALVNTPEGWRVRGLDLTAPSADDEPFSLGALGALEMTDLRLTIEDAQHDLHLALTAPVLRLLNRGATTRALGRVHLVDGESPPLEFVGDFNFATRTGQLYAGGRDIDIGRIVSQQAVKGLRLVGGRGALQLWARITAGHTDDVRVRVDLAGAQFDSAAPLAVEEQATVTPHVGFERLAFVARWLRRDDGWSFDLAHLIAGADTPAAQQGRLGIERSGSDDAPRYRAGATMLPLEPFGSVAMLTADLPEGARRWLYLAHPRGMLSNASVDWSGAGEHDVAAQIRDLSLASTGAAPGVERVDFDVQGDADALLVHLPQQALQVDFPHLFRQPFLFSAFGGDVVARRVDEAWRLETDRIAFEGAGYGGELRGGVDVFAGRRPVADLYATVTHGEVPAAKLFWPIRTMPPKAMSWLDRALVGGTIINGRAALHGDLADWPFHDRSGYFIARAEVGDLILDYDQGWPRAEKMHAIANFINDGMQVDVDAGETMGNTVSQASASIPDFGPMLLDLSVKGEGSGASLLGFLRATPIGRRYQDQLKDLAISGKGALGFTLNLPIKQIEALTLDGSVDLSGAKLDHMGYDLHFLDATGKLRFNQKGFAADRLDVGYRGRRAKFSMAIGGYVSDPQHALEVTLSGRFPAATVFDMPAIQPMLSKFPGETDWTANVVVDRADKGSARTRIGLESDLRGLRIDLPAPFAKTAEGAVPFRLDVALPAAGQSFVARLGDIAGIRGQMPGNGRVFGARIDFGTQAPGPAPADGLVVGGHAAALDVSAWLDFMNQGGGSSGIALHGIDVHADDVLFAGRHFADMRLAVDNTTATTAVRLDGPAVAGSFAIPKGSAAIEARFDRVYWPEAPSENADVPSDGSAFADVAPATLPPLQVAIADFRLGKASFGSAEFRSHPADGGMRVDKLESHSPNVTMKASGTWTGSAKNNSSHLAIQLSAQNLGHMMDALGFPGLIDGGETRAAIDASWSGPPWSFALPKLDGTLDIDVAEGRVLDVEPGPGRIFGLFSLTEIPRRLSLDFSDFFKSGFSFNSIKGRFRLADGNAYTDGLTINSPAADIVVTGRTGLRAKDYDQQMSVSPRAGATLPIVGALAAGPIGAAAGIVMQGILNKPIGQAVGSRYRVSGSWDKPKITLISRERPDSRKPRAKPKAPEEPAAAPDRQP